MERAVVLPLVLVILGHPGLALNPPSCDEATTSLVVNQLAILQVMRDASHASSAAAELCTEREARREEEAAAREARLEEVLQRSQETLETLRIEVHNATQETLKGVAALREEMTAQGRLLQEVRRLSACPDGWFRYEYSCYHFNRTYYHNWEESLQFCRNLGGDLVKITNAGEQMFVIGHLGDGFYSWIGLSDRAQEGHFVWTDGSAPTYKPWRSGNPDNHGTGEDCVYLTSRSSDWNDYACTDRGSGVVCEIQL